MAFENQVVVVTGGSRGIGKAIVADFAAQGAKVYFTYNKHDDAANETAAETGAKAVKCPQGDGKLIGKTAEEIVAEAGAIHVLVNNAGVTSDQFLMMMPYDQWDKVMDTNVNGVFRWVKAVVRPMLTAQSGVIINVASVAGLVGIAGQTNYAASKGALLAFTRALAAELGPKGVRVNAVVPGFIETDMTAIMPRQIKRRNLEQILAKRFGKPEEIARVVSFLASENASYIYGQALVVDGGLTATVA